MDDHRAVNKAVDHKAVLHKEVDHKAKAALHKAMEAMDNKAALNKAVDHKAVKMDLRILKVGGIFFKTIMNGKKIWMDMI